MFKKILYLLIILLLLNLKTFADDENNLRTMFQNNQAVIYAINVRSFNANDKNGNGIIDVSLGETSGSFINAIDRLDEIKELGVNTLHLLPITPVGKMKAFGSAGSLYAIADFRTFNLQLADSQSELSIKNQAKKFVEECHKRNIKVMVDLPSCGSYDMFISRPELFVVDNNGKAYIPADWLDVRLFNVPNNETLFKSDIFMLHKRFINNMLDIGVDGIRADVATVKPFIFWKELIKYTRSKKSDFMFLAEASEKWTLPVSDKAYFTDYKKLLEAGFDGYYGSFFELKNQKTADEFHNPIINNIKTLKKYSEKKSLIGSFATHDEVSPLIIGGEAFSKMIIWLNATLPLNPYYVDGFIQGDDYMYEYSNKKAAETFTDDEYYYVHQGQIDIFNFSRKPGGDNENLILEHKKAMKLRSDFHDVIEKGRYIPIRTNNNKVFAFQRYLNGKSVIVIINRNLINTEDVKTKIKYINKKTKVNFEKTKNDNQLIKSTFTAKLKPGEVVVFTAY